MNCQKLKNDFINMKDKTLKEVCDILRKYDMNWEISLSYFVASLFGVDRADMLSKDRSKDIVYARWFYWYVLRKVCKKDYETIAQEVSIDDAIIQIPGEPTTIRFSGLTAVFPTDSIITLGTGQESPISLAA